MLAEERRRRLLQILDKTGVLSVADVSGRMQVSRMTVHRDLELLAAAGLLRKVHGGAIPVQRNAAGQDMAMPFTERKVVHTDAKQRIAENLLPLIATARSLALDASSTVYPLAHLYIPPPGTFVLTDGIPLFTELQYRNLGIKLSLTGGESHPKTGSLIGRLAIKSLEGMRFDCAVVSAAGLMEQSGEVVDATPEGAAFKQALIARASRTILALDRSKLNFLALHQWARIEDFDYLVTEDGVQEIERKKRNASGRNRRVELT